MSALRQRCEPRLSKGQSTPVDDVVDSTVNIERTTPRHESDADRRSELRAFLMSRRARLQPTEVGLPTTKRRRTPGLRREEVAQLAGFSVEWYSLFESGSDTRVSEQTIAAVARVLRLSDIELRHLKTLARGPESEMNPSTIVDPVLSAMADAFKSIAIVHDPLINVFYANSAAAAAFGQLNSLYGIRRNFLYTLATNRDVRARIVDPDAIIADFAGTIRIAYCSAPRDSATEALLQALMESSDAFRTTWASHDVTNPTSNRTVQMMSEGKLRTYVIRSLAGDPQTHPGQGCCLWIPYSL